jgi:homoaconitase/3-isopropylmalate dehydratase large subunit
MSGATLFENIWRSHMVRSFGERALIHIDRHFVHEGTSRNAFDGLRNRKRGVKNLELTFGVIDHDPSTLPGRTAQTYEPSRERIGAMQENCREFQLHLFDVNDPGQGIVHVIATEQGIVLPGMTVVCGDSHTATSGGIGAWGWGIGTTEVERVFATQTLLLPKPKTMRANFLGRVADGVTAKDLILYLIGQHGVAVGTGYAVEYAGPAIRAMPVDGRLTICNMSIEFGARSGMIAPDDTTIQFFAGRPYAPKGKLWDQAAAYWRTLPTAPDAEFDREMEIDCRKVKPQITWGTSPQEVIGVDERIPDPSEVAAERRATMAGGPAYRLCLHRLVHQQPPVRPQGRGRGDQRAQGARDRDGAGGARLVAGEGRSRSGRPRPHFQGRRFPVARIGMLHVPDARWRLCAFRPALHLDLEPQFRGSPGAQEPDASREPRHGGGGRRAWPHRRRAAGVTNEEGRGPWKSSRRCRA